MKARRYRDDDELEGYAQRLRRAAAIEFIQVPPIQEVVQNFRKIFPRLQLLAVPDERMGDDDAVTDGDEKTITIKRSVWLSACDGHSRARMTVFHELAHVALNHGGYRYRAAGRDLRSNNISTTKSDEVEAKRFAGMLIVPGYLVSDYGSTEEITRDFNVGIATARIRLESVAAADRRRKGELRPLPKAVQEYLFEKAALGHPVKSLAIAAIKRPDVSAPASWIRSLSLFRMREFDRSSARF